MVDPGRIRALLDRIEDELGHLRRFGERPNEDLLEDRDALAAVKYGFIVVIEACIDIADHVIASESLKAPETYADAFAVLGDAKMLEADLAGRLQKMVGFRNLLIHEYAKVEDSIVVEILQRRLGDIEAYRRAVASLI